MRRQIEAALGLQNIAETVGNEKFPSRFCVSEMAAASVGAVGGAIAELVKDLNLAPSPPQAFVDQRLSSLWFAQSIWPDGWRLPPVWDAVAGDYQTRDGWIKLHTNLPHHREAALSVLGVRPEREKVASAVRDCDADALEDAIVAAGGVAAAMRSRDEWLRHPQGQAVATEPLIGWDEKPSAHIGGWNATRARPLSGLRVLDLTRVLAGPVATRTLAGFGADVLRIDPPGWDEPNVVPDITLGKRCSFLNLDTDEGHETFERLLTDAHMLVHGYRPGALDRLGFHAKERQRIAPGLIEVCLDAYGWTGPWAGRRGFDSLVQMSCGIAHAGMAWAGRDAPTPLPVQALDHATGYLMAASAVQALRAAIKGKVRTARLSLARTAELLLEHPQYEDGVLDKNPLPDDLTPALETTPWGAAHRLKPPLDIEGAPMAWTGPASNLGAAQPVWL